MVEEILGVVKLEVPKPPVRTLPPVDAEYQSMAKPASGFVTDNDTAPVPQREPLTGPEGAIGKWFTVKALEGLYHFISGTSE